MNLDDAILHHLDRLELRDQSTLLNLLRAAGFDLTLSTLSRRLARLQVRKVQGVYRQGPRFQTPGQPSIIRRVPPCLLILKTQPGTAQALAVAMDTAGLPSLAGSVAGYDTIFAAPVDPGHLDTLEQELRAFLARC